MRPFVGIGRSLTKDSVPALKNPQVMDSTLGGVSVTKALVREVWDLVVPVIIQGMVVTVVFFTDRLLIGQYSDTALASMQISGVLLWSLFSVFGAFTAGTMAVIGRAVGGRDEATARNTLNSVMLLATGIGLATMVLCLSLQDWFAHVLAAGEDTMEAQGLAVKYMGIVFLGMPLNLIQMTGVTALQADGDTATPMWISAIQGILNLGVSWVLLWGYGPFPEMGIEGAAIGTLASFALGAAAILFTLFTRSGTVKLVPLDGPSLSSLSPVVRLSIPAFGEKIAFHTAFVIFAAYVGHLGALEMSANQALIAIESLGFMVAHGFSIAASALVAQKLGAQRPNEATAVGWISAGLGAAVLGVVGLLFWFFPATFLGWFTDNPVLIEMGVPCLKLAAAIQPVMAICDAMSGSLRGAGDTRTPMLAAFIGPGVVRLFFCWYLAFEMDMGLFGIWVGTSLDWLVRLVFLTVMFSRGKWRRISV